MGGKYMQLQSEKNEEKFMNKIMFFYNVGIPIAGWAFVMLFLNGGLRECFVLLIILCAILTKVFEKQLGGQSQIYICLPFAGNGCINYCNFMYQR